MSMYDLAMYDHVLLCTDGWVYACTRVRPPFQDPGLAFLFLPYLSVLGLRIRKKLL